MTRIRFWKLKMAHLFGINEGYLIKQGKVSLGKLELFNTWIFTPFDFSQFTSADLKEILNFIEKLEKEEK